MAFSISRVVWIFLLLVTASAPSMGQEPGGQDSVGAQIRNLGWKVGPSEGKIAGRATIGIPANYRFLGAADTSKFLTLQRNLPTTDSYTFAPDNLDWFAIFDFEDTGYIKDDEKIDADAVLQSRSRKALRVATRNANGVDTRSSRSTAGLFLRTTTRALSASNGRPSSARRVASPSIIAFDSSAGRAS
jgi:uncharacterized membrane-anchored protein